MHLFQEALTLKFLNPDGKLGKPYGKEEFDKWLANYDVRMPLSFPHSLPHPIFHLLASTNTLQTDNSRNPPIFPPRIHNLLPLRQIHPHPPQHFILAQINRTQRRTNVRNLPKIPRLLGSKI